MYRCIKEVRGLVFDIDGFLEDEIEEIASLFRDYKISCMTSSDKVVPKLENIFPAEHICKMDGVQRFLAPNIVTHAKVLKSLEIKATEMLYVSKRIGFLSNAASFFGGTVWITDSVNYKSINTTPDLICKSLSKFSSYLKDNVEGFLGEVAVFPNVEKKKGVIIPVTFQADQGNCIMFILGRYFSYTQYMSQLHPYSSAIYLNKNEESKAYGSYNTVFKNLFLKAVNLIQTKYKVDGICAVPVRPGRKERFSGILEAISEEAGISNFGPSLVCVKDYASQKGLSSPERKENIKGVFSFNKKLNGETVVIIDDVVTTGSTINECINVLKEAGAGTVYVIVLAANQYGVEYWSSNTIQLSCPDCGDKMRLLINSAERTFFYKCTSCRSSSMNYITGRRLLEEKVNQEMSKENLDKIIQS